MRSFEFKSSVEEFKIGDKVYQIDFSDQKVKSYQRSFVNFHVKSQELSDKIDKATPEIQEILFDQTLQLVKELLDQLLGSGSFDELYEKSGKSLINMMDLIAFLSEVVVEKADKAKNERLEKYVKNKKRR
jgi:hypothetical protein